jgi:hypothetical protein
MSYRQELEEKIRVDIESQDTTDYSARLVPRLDRDVADAISAVTAYCNALKEALLDAAFEIDRLRTSN